MIKKFVNRLLLAPLKVRRLREHLAFHIRQRHYDLLQVRVPLARGMSTPVVSEEAWVSFSEVFLQGEYEEVFRLLLLPDRWIDLGCHAGFFSLFIEQKRRLGGRISKPEALLIDADSRSARAIERAIALNGLEGQLTFEHGAVAPGAGVVQFNRRAFMASSVAGIDGQPGESSFVPILPPARILELLPPPYDLIKVDIEGSEHDFIDHYKPVWSQARHLVLEVHRSPSTGQSWEKGADRITRDTGFERVRMEGGSNEPKRPAGLLVLRNPDSIFKPGERGSNASH